MLERVLTPPDRRARTAFADPVAVDRVVDLDVVWLFTALPILFWEVQDNTGATRSRCAALRSTFGEATPAQLVFDLVGVDVLVGIPPRRRPGVGEKPGHQEGRAVVAFAASPFASQ